MPQKRLIVPIILLAGVSPVQAECLGACASDLTAAFFSLIAYGLIAIVLLVMLIRGKWRRAGLWSLGVVVVLAVGVPLLSQVWLTWKLRAVEAREVVGSPPALSSRTPLLITPDEYCEGNACTAVLEGRGATGTHALLTRSLDQRDLSGPVPIADLPLEFWTLDPYSGQVLRRELTPQERQEAAVRIDYLIVGTWPYARAEPGPIETALRANPALTGMGPTETVRLMLAALNPAQGVLALAEVEPDILDLNLQDRALAIPLAPRNDRGAGNGPAGLDAVAGAICPADDAYAFATCRSLLER